MLFHLICGCRFRTSLFQLADPKNFTKEELGELFCMELEVTAELFKQIVF